ncbi:hypothetical protein SAMN04515672_4386 [Natronorubrum texcoconense]|uniref:Uncharacterized protein n=2 Tax=Natronorubrum texcoconense TaxID=1095776 RepID=A0A1G9G1X7_9EURY|nr:hypothetical protein SAMN04515672_4386 [Natronorubrum texcoconense]
MTTEWFIDHLEELDAHVARLLDSIPDTEAFDDETRARTRRRLREIRAQINPLLVVLHSRVDTDDGHSRATTNDSHSCAATDERRPHTDSDDRGSHTESDDPPPE